MTRISLHSVRALPCSKLRSPRVSGKVIPNPCDQFGAVIPGRAEGASPEPITPAEGDMVEPAKLSAAGVMDSRLAASRRPGMTAEWISRIPYRTMSVRPFRMSGQLV
jgi:hypothetical protein